MNRIQTITAIAALVIGCSNLESNSSLSAADSGWRHISLRSTDSTEVSIDFQNVYVPFQGSGGQLHGDLASPLWINLKHQSLTGYETVMATFKRYCRRLNSGDRWTGCGTESVRLLWDSRERKFTEQTSLVLLSSGVSQTCQAYEISFFVSDYRRGTYRLIDPVNHTENFVINLASEELRSRCASH